MLELYRVIVYIHWILIISLKTDLILYYAIIYIRWLVQLDGTSYSWMFSMAMTL
jgi:hypothetical protein